MGRFFCAVGADLMKRGVHAKMESSWGEEESRSEQESDFAEKSLSANTANDDEITGTKELIPFRVWAFLLCFEQYRMIQVLGVAYIKTPDVVYPKDQNRL